MIRFTVERTIQSPIEKVWAVAGDFLKAPGDGVTVQVEKPGDPVSGIGAERTICIGMVRVRERLMDMNHQNRWFMYSVLSGAPMKDHVAKAVFRPAGLETNIQWHVSFRPALPGIGWLVAAVTRKAVNGYLDAVVRGVQ